MYLLIYISHHLFFIPHPSPFTHHFLLFTIALFYLFSKSVHQILLKLYLMTCIKQWAKVAVLDFENILKIICRENVLQIIIKANMVAASCKTCLIISKSGRWILRYRANLKFKLNFFSGEIGFCTTVETRLKRIIA